MATLWDRRYQRIDFRATVDVTQPQNENSLCATALNLSEAGIFVAVREPAAVGTEVTCFVPLAGHVRPLRGRVAWVRAGGDPRGMGIEFIDLTTSDSRVLRETVGDDDDHPITAWFQGLRDPVGARAILTPTGMRLRAALPFLRVGAPVEFAPSDRLEERHRGRLHDVRLHVTPGEPTYLEVDVALTPPARGQVSRGGAGLATRDIVSGVLESNAPAPEAAPRKRRPRFAMHWIGLGLVTGAAMLAVLELAVDLRRASLPGLPPIPAAPVVVVVDPPAPTPTPTLTLTEAPAVAPRALSVTAERLFVPTSGTVSDARILRLGDPPAMIVDLPRATTPLAAGEHPLDAGGFRLLKVRVRPEGGIQLRVFFTHDPPGVAALESTDGGVTVVFPQP